MSDLACNTEVSIIALSEGTAEALQGGFPEDVLRSLERIWQDHHGSNPGEFFLTRERLGELLESHLTEDSHRALLPEVFKSIGEKRALVQRIRPLDDFTFFVGRKKSDASAGAAAGEVAVIEDLLGGKIDTQRDGELWLWDDAEQKAAYGRVVVCSCWKGKEWSITFRPQREYPPRDRKSQFFNTFEEIAGLLRSIIFAQGDVDEHGLVVIAGRTGSGKSQIARQLIQYYLDRSPRDRRIPHLVTFEDPIEKDFRQAEKAETDCTQREKLSDATSLTEVLQNALRQTPRVLFVGETRRPRDWERLLEFAGTGHLVMTTAHAGSLVEAVGNIFQETQSHTPATRSIVADRLLAVVHLKTATDANQTSFLIPAIWHRTPLGIKALMAEGLSSLLPNTPPEGQPAANRARFPGSVGRYWFARELVKKETALNFPAAAEAVKRTALEWDLEGI